MFASFSLPPHNPKPFHNSPSEPKMRAKISAKLSSVCKGLIHLTCIFILINLTYFLKKVSLDDGCDLPISSNGVRFYLLSC